MSISSMASTSLMASNAVLWSQEYILSEKRQKTFFFVMVIVLKKWQRKSDPREGVRKRREADSPSFITVIGNSLHRKLPTHDLRGAKKSLSSSGELGCFKIPNP